MHRSTLLTVRGAAAATATGALLALGTLPASAHVTVHADTTTTGEWSALTFRVPNESDEAATKKLVVTLPQDTPLASVSVRPVPGWTAKVTDKKLPKPYEQDGLKLTEAPRTITWTADSKEAAIQPGEYEEFAISGGPLPKPGTMLIPAKQTYSDGEVVAWDEEPTKGGEEPEHPAPTVEVTKAGAEQPADEASASTGQQGATADSSDTTARVLAGAALLVALVGAGFAGVAARRRG